MSAERPSINVNELPLDVRRQLAKRGVTTGRKPRTQTMNKNDIRTAAIRVLNVVADLSPAERSRVLAHAAKLNDV